MAQQNPVDSEKFTISLFTSDLCPECRRRAPGDFNEKKFDCKDITWRIMHTHFTHGDLMDTGIQKAATLEHLIMEKIGDAIQSDWSKDDIDDAVSFYCDDYLFHPSLSRWLERDLETEHAKEEEPKYDGKFKTICTIQISKATMANTIIGMLDRIDD